MIKLLVITTLLLFLTACGGGGGGGGGDVSPATATTQPDTTQTEPAEEAPANEESSEEATGADEAPPMADEAVEEPEIALTGIDLELHNIIDQEGLTGDPSLNRNLPAITSPVAELGRLLFFSKKLGGEEDSACVSCHHPVLGGADDLSLSIGVHAVDVNNLSDPDLLGLGRHPVTAGGTPIVPRNAPTIFNSGMWDEGMFWDSRVASLGGEVGENGRGSTITTPDSDQPGTADNNLASGVSLPAAQARFPVTSDAEMRGEFGADLNNQELRNILAARFNDELTNWPARFESAFGDPGVTFDRIADAIGEYERSMVFVDSPWRAYVQGDLDALTQQQKEGAVLFFTDVDDGGAGCVECHSGDTFSDSEHHVVGFPQISDDFGRENINGDERDRYSFRTASLLNITATAPYGHAGLYNTLEEVIDHYDNPRAQVNQLFGVQGGGGPGGGLGNNNGQPFENPNAPFCQLPQIVRIIEITGEDCENIFPNAYTNSIASVDRINDNDARNTLGQTPNLNNGEIAEIEAFLEALTDPCIENRACLDPWIVDADDIGNYPDDSALVAHDELKLDL